MKKVLYLSNIEVPYRSRFFNQLAETCDLTVLYERESSANRNLAWAKSENCRYRSKCLDGIKISRENAFSFRVLHEIFSGYDIIIIGCYNSAVQMVAILAMRLFHVEYFLNLDGEPFFKDGGLKGKIKRFFVKKAEKYLVAGEKSAESALKVVGDRPVFPYYFSSLTQQEIADHAALSHACRRSDMVLVVGQYFDYKGMDVALEAARMNQTIRYKFVGMGKRTELMQKEHQIPENVELMPFLQKQELEKEYQTCGMLVLPSRQECWGLVINEAASFGMPIVSTWGSGAAVEFLADDWPQYLAKPGDAEDLLRCIESLSVSKDREEYSRYLLEKSKDYSIERSVQAYSMVLD